MKRLPFTVGENGHFVANLWTGDLHDAGFQEGDEAVVVLRSELEALEKQAPKVWIILGKLDGAYEILAIWATEAAADAELQQILGRGRHGFQSVMVQEYLVDDVEPSRGKPE